MAAKARKYDCPRADEEIKVRRQIVLMLMLVTAGCAACDDPNAGPKEKVDRQTCLSAELSPIDALSACSRFISAAQANSLPYASAYYNRGVAFAELGQFRHAQLDLLEALTLDPKNRWARQRLDYVREKLAKN